MYGGKELVSMHGLNLYDFMARMQDPLIPRFTTMDPMCEMFYPVSPYAYCLNNPVKYTDPDGQIPVETIWDIGNLVYDVGAAIYNHTTGNHAVAKEHWVDAGADLVATLIPYVPAGGSKVLKVADATADVAKTADKVADAAKATGKASGNVRNPNGSKGKPDHQAEVEKLKERALEENPGQVIKTEKKIQVEGSNRRPDVQVIDPKTEKTTKVYEAERRPKSRRNIDREKEYRRLAIPFETVTVGGY